MYYAIYSVKQQTLSAVKTLFVLVATPLSSDVITVLFQLQLGAIVLGG
jgi:hypothetical protein